MFTEGAAAARAGRAASSTDARRRARSLDGARRRGRATPRARPRPGWPRSQSRALDRRARRAPAPRAGHHRGALPAVRRPAARAVRLLVRVLPALRGRHRRPGDRQGRLSGTFRTAAKRLDAVADHGLRRRLPAADPPDRRGQPQGPQQHPRPRPGRPGLPVGDRLEGRRPRRDPPRPRHLRGLRRLRRPRPRASASRSRSTSRCSARPTTRGSTQHPEWFTTRADGTIAYAENPPKKYQDIYPINFDNDPDRHLPRGAADRQALDVARRADLPRRQPAHQAGRVLGVAARARSAGPTPTCSSWPRRSPGRR